MNTPRTLLFALALFGCSESPQAPAVDAAPDQGVDAVIDVTTADTITTDTVPDTATDTITSDAPTDVVRPDATVDGSSDAAVDSNGDAPPVDGGSANLVINEISAAGDEWVELYNAGTAPFDLSFLRVADSESDGGPRASRAMRFPAGTMLSPGQYVLVLANQSDAGVGPQTRCLDGGPSTCFHATWSISASRGETVWVLSSTGDVTLQELYPMNAAADGQTWGRLPNGTGAFAVNRPTPGALNAAP